MTIHTMMENISRASVFPLALWQPPLSAAHAADDPLLQPELI
jgi:hypothetical protein